MEKSFYTLVNKLLEEKGLCEPIFIKEAGLSPNFLGCLRAGRLFTLSNEVVICRIAKDEMLEFVRLERARRIRRLNDLARAGKEGGCTLVQSPGLHAIPPPTQSAIREKVAHYNDFNDEKNLMKSMNLGNLTMMVKRFTV